MAATTRRHGEKAKRDITVVLNIDLNEIVNGVLDWVNPTTELAHYGENNHRTVRVFSLIHAQERESLLIPLGLVVDTYTINYFGDRESKGNAFSDTGIA